MVARLHECGPSSDELGKYCKRGWRFYCWWFNVETSYNLMDPSDVVPSCEGALRPFGDPSTRPTVLSSWQPQPRLSRASALADCHPDHQSHNAMSATITAPLAALTTIFTPPCSISWLLTSSKNPSQYPAFPTAGPTTCDPPNWAGNIANKGFQYYSPAICPSGFEVGPSCQITKTRTSEGFPSVEAGETAVYCVPR